MIFTRIECDGAVIGSIVFRSDCLQVWLSKTRSQI